RALADPRALPAASGRFRRLPPVRLPRAPRRARRGCPGRDRPAEFALRSGGRLGPPAARRPGDHAGQAGAALRGRRLRPRARSRSRRTHQRDHAERILRPLSGVLPRETAVARIKEAIARTYARKGAAVVERNCAAVDASLAALHEVPLPEQAT